MSIAVESNSKLSRASSGLQTKARKAKAITAKSGKATRAVGLSPTAGGSYMLIEVGADGQIDSGLSVNPRDVDRMVDALILMLATARRIGRQ